MNFSQRPNILQSPRSTLAPLLNTAASQIYTDLQKRPFLWKARLSHSWYPSVAWSQRVKVGSTKTRAENRSRHMSACHCICVILRVAALSACLFLQPYLWLFSATNTYLEFEMVASATFCLFCWCDALLLESTSGYYNYALLVLTVSFYQFLYGILSYFVFRISYWASLRFLTYPVMSCIPGRAYASVICSKSPRRYNSLMTVNSIHGSLTTAKSFRGLVHKKRNIIFCAARLLPSLPPPKIELLVILLSQA
jgi:hypothetical protein